MHNGVRHELKSVSDNSVQNTQFYGPDALEDWDTVTPLNGTSPGILSTEILEISTLDGIRYILSQTSKTASAEEQTNDGPHMRVGVLNFASATKPGGGFINGAQAQEESLARSSTLYPTLICQAGTEFHAIHKRDKKGGYYSHSMVYSPDIVFFRDDAGGWEAPVQADVLTSAAVNAGVARRTLFGKVGGVKEEARIEAAMRERMSRILYLFERERVKNLVLGSFGTGVFQNNVEMVARVWADLLVVPGSRFEHSFDRIVFAILGRETFETFLKSFTTRKEKGASITDASEDTAPDS